MPMTPVPLLVSTLLERGALLAPQEEIVTVGKFGTLTQTYAETRRNACKLANALSAAGVGIGDKVATLMWNNHRHQEAFYAVPSMGAVIHTLNSRLTGDEIAYMIEHAQDKVLLVDSDFVPIIEELLPRLPSIRKVLVCPISGPWQSQSDMMVEWEQALEGQPVPSPT